MIFYEVCLFINSFDVIHVKFVRKRYAGKTFSFGVSNFNKNKNKIRANHCNLKNKYEY